MNMKAVQIDAIRIGNKTTVRVIHNPTGLYVTKTGRMEYKLRKEAIAELEEKFKTLGLSHENQ